MDFSSAPGAVAVFVKTPGLSPIKTRLARTAGRELAERFFELSAQALEAMLSRASEEGRFTVYWAVAEPEATGALIWSGLPVLPQGDGGLGARLSRVYSELQARHGFAILLGADSPQLPVSSLASAVSALRTGPGFALGPAEDGGFYLFGGNLPLPEQLWESVTYSEATTFAALRREIAPLGPILELDRLLDVDTGEDALRLQALLERAAQVYGLTPELAILLDWMRGVKGWK